jgi:hypothetical protein
MRGIPLFNFPAFEAGTAALRELGHEVHSPAEHDLAGGFDPALSEEANRFSLREAMAADLSWICLNADAVVVLPGWENSAGATAEVRTAESIGIPVLTPGEVPEDPDVIRGIERVTGETYRDGQWARERDGAG